ncbi:hypothetical protein LTR37_013461 [Vermiconidia calcicola]|uniref:Uncharacterized protein n=1 Tax=Vermiconidia calcicola TaxID=1690605 RepID=A0ACC3MWL2_9PEZI|nr:hypothetical protein LTR37_013461 [Vermiconidia calcicola]
MPTGAKIIAKALHELGVKVVFGLVGLPVIDIAEEVLNLGIRFIAFRNEQSASYAASAYGYLTGRPGICLLVGGPGVLHGMAGIGNSNANKWPLLVLAGSSERHNVNKGAFQELDHVSLIKPHAKTAIRPPYPGSIPNFIADAYRSAYFGTPGTSFVDLPADMILNTHAIETEKLSLLPASPQAVAPTSRIKAVVQALKNAQAPLVVIGKGAAYARAEQQIRELINRTELLFLPTPMGKGVMPDSSPYNTSSARATALRESDVILVLGARLNWILHFGEAPKWKPSSKIIQVDLSADELGKNGGDPWLSMVGDVGLVVEQISAELGSWKWQGRSSAFTRKLTASREKNEATATRKAAVDRLPMTYERAYDVIKKTLHSLSTPEDGDIVYVSEGSNSMDIGRSIFTVEHPRIRLDAATYATMGIGLGAAIAAHAAYNLPEAEGSSGKPGRKKIIAIEGDSAFGFSAMEIETMARYEMDILVFVVNNGGIYQGTSASMDEWLVRQRATAEGTTTDGKGLRSLTLGYEVGYEKLADTCGGLGLVARTPDELRKATEEGFRAKVPAVVNVLIESGAERVMDFSWLDVGGRPDSKPESKL